MQKNRKRRNRKKKNKKKKREQEKEQEEERKKEEGREKEPEVEIEYVTEEPAIYDPNFIFFKRIFEAFKVRSFRLNRNSRCFITGCHKIVGKCNISLVF